MNSWIVEYIAAQQMALQSLPVDAIIRLIDILRSAVETGHQIFVCGNGGSAANASHFATDLGKGASDALGRRFRVISLNDNVPWITAIGNDCSYADVFVRQLENFAQPQDVLLVMSVSGDSPNVVNAVDWAVGHDLKVIALVGGKQGKVARRAGEVIVVNSDHYGRVEDIHMSICHLLAYAFMEGKAVPLGKRPAQ